MQDTDTPRATVRWDRLIFDKCIDCNVSPAVGCAAGRHGQGRCKSAEDHAKRDGGWRCGASWNPRCTGCHKGDVRAWAKDAGLTYYVDEHGDPYTARRLPPQPVSAAIKRHKAWVRAVESRLRQSPDKITKAEAAKLVARVRSKGRKVEHGKQLEIEGTTVTIYNDQGRLAAWRYQIERSKQFLAQTQLSCYRNDVKEAASKIHALERKLGITPTEA